MQSRNTIYFFHSSQYVLSSPRTFLDVFQGVHMASTPMIYACNNNNENEGSTLTRSSKGGHQSTDVGSDLSEIVMPPLNLSFSVKLENSNYLIRRE